VKKVLVVDDRPYIVTTVMSMLKICSKGLVVVFANSGEEAEKIINKPDSNIDVVISDVNMPGGMTGVELADKVVEKHPHIVFVLMSDKEPQQHQAHAFVLKPFEQGELMGTLKMAVEKKKGPTGRT
jgi:DNA-binding NtrC family response regulator